MSGGQIVAHWPVHALVPGVVSFANVYNVKPLSSTRTVPSLVDAVATVGFADVAADVGGVDDEDDAAVVVGEVAGDADLELLPHAASANAANAAAAMYRK